MNAFLGLVRTSENASTADEAILLKALAAVGAEEGAVAIRRGPGWIAAGSPSDPRTDLAHGVLRPHEGTDPVYVARRDDLTLVGDRVRALLATGLVPRAVDPVGLSGLLWRGAPMDARLPAVGIVAIPPGDRFVAGRGIEVGAPIGIPGWPVNACVTPSWRVPAEPGAVAGLHERYLAVADMPSADGFRAFLAAWALVERRAATITENEHAPPCDESLLEAMSAPRRAPVRLRRPRPGGDPADIAEQRAIEVDALAEVPVHRAQSILALFPAATRRALATLPERGPDGVVPASVEGREMAAELARRGAFVDGPLRDQSVAFAATGARTALPVRGGDADDPVLDGWLRGPLAPFLSSALGPDRLAAQRFWNPGAVAEGVSRWRARRAGWTARHVFLLAHVAHWVERERLAIEAP